MNDLPLRQRIARHITTLVLILAFLALVGLAGHIETSGQW